MYKKILIPIMGQYMDELVESALHLISDSEVEVTCLYVVDNSLPFLTPKRAKKMISHQLNAEGKLFLNEIEEKFNEYNKSNVTFKRELVEGKPGETIIKKAKENFDVIVMGTGKSIVDKHLLGSVSEEVVHYAPCTIHLVRTFDRDVKSDNK